MFDLSNLGLTGLFSTGMLFVIGVMVGEIVKRTIKLVMTLIALISCLTATGYLSSHYTNDASTIAILIAKYLPRIQEFTSFLGTVLPISSTAFLFGTALGLWKG